MTLAEVIVSTATRIGVFLLRLIAVAISNIAVWAILLVFHSIPLTGLVLAVFNLYAIGYLLDAFLGWTPGREPWYGSRDLFRTVGELRGEVTEEDPWLFAGTKADAELWLSNAGRKKDGK